MKESYIEGLANHDGPESCVGHPQGDRRSVDRGTHRQGIELRKQAIRGADAVVRAGRQHAGVRYGECIWDPAQSKTPGMCGNSMRENREIPCFPCTAQGRIGKILRS